MMGRSAAVRLVHDWTTPTRTALVPEISLRLAREAYQIYQSADEVGAERPFWAFAWPGGQAIARFLIDNPSMVAARRVLDIGAGSGIGGIAALAAGASVAVANDTDPMACVAAGINAAANGVALETCDDDLLGDALDFDLILVGELFYEPEMAVRVTAFLERVRHRGVDVVFADRSGIRRPSVDFDLVAEMVAPLTPDLGIDGMDRARVWRLSSGNGRRLARRSPGKVVT